VKNVKNLVEYRKKFNKYFRIYTKIRKKWGL